MGNVNSPEGLKSGKEGDTRLDRWRVTVSPQVPGLEPQVCIRGQVQMGGGQQLEERVTVRYSPGPGQML